MASQVLGVGRMWLLIAGKYMFLMSGNRPTRSGGRQRRREQSGLSRCLKTTNSSVSVSARCSLPSTEIFNSSFAKCSICINTISVLIDIGLLYSCKKRFWPRVSAVVAPVICSRQGIDRSLVAPARAVKIFWYEILLLPLLTARAEAFLPGYLPWLALLWRRHRLSETFLKF